ncbi:putative pectinesterase/pectinesterase inhibitor 36 [Vitis vinifera]|uniref:Putative pectinesterase/pectinesterase inhibitor 36 n=1 Tax=Vitis vinifera TaxID=29760 RepID=A0A438FU86_VITVI|nr:putative pectinesterase/pectinesterase inhibitor 36 [Vitis vinifera]
MLPVSHDVPTSHAVPVGSVVHCALSTAARLTATCQSTFVPRGYLNQDCKEPTGISVQGSRVLSSPEFTTVKGSFKSFLGRPWKRYSRTVFLETDLDGLIDPRGWTEWSGNHGLSTLYYGEYNNSGDGASTKERVKWPGFHVLNGAEDAMPFTVSRFIQGENMYLIL